MYNNSNGSVEHGDADPSQKGPDSTPERPDPKNAATNVEDKPAESECTDDREEENEEDVGATDPVDKEASAASDLNNTAESVPNQEEGSGGEEKEECVEKQNTDPEEKADDDAPVEDATEDKPSKEELEEEGDVKDETKEEPTVELEKKEEVAHAPAKEKVTVNLDLCRVCMGKEDLTDIFQLEGPVRISDIIMKVCTNVRITARDHLPHKICERCLGQVRIVNEFKLRCEASDKELRKTLSRSSNKTRRPVIVVNCPMSDSENEDEPVDDDEYQVSQSEVESEPATSDDSFSPPTKRKRTPAKRGRKPAQYSTPPARRGRPGRKPKNMAIETPPVQTPTPKRGPGRPPKNPKTPTLSNIVYIEAPEDSSSSDDVSEQKRRRRKRGDNPCPKCDEVFPSQLALKQHLKTHPADVFNCDRCPLWFRTQQALTNHIERHKKADRIRDEKRREREQRQDQRYREPNRSSDADDRKAGTQFSSSTEKKKKLDVAPTSTGRDLFKCVAPLTSTYWSDSFSE